MKRLSLLAVALCVAVSAMAQVSLADLEGKWGYAKTDKQKLAEKDAVGDADIKMSAIYVFDGDSFVCTLKAVMNMDLSMKDSQNQDMDAVFIIEITATTTGASTLASDQLTLVPDKKKKPKVDVDATIKGVPGGNMLKGMLASPIKQALVSELKEIQQYRVISVSETTLCLQSIVSEKDAAKGIKADTITLTRL